MTTTTDRTNTVGYWRAVATAMQGQLTQRTVVADEYLTPYWIHEWDGTGTGHGAPRYRVTPAPTPEAGYRTVAQVRVDGTVQPA